jgi:hypothetical protein
MEYNVVFEITQISKIHYLAPVGVFCGLFLIAFSVFLSSFGTAAHTSFWRPLLSLLFSVVFLYFSIQLTASTMKMLDQTYGKYERGDIQVVEGTVEDCDTAFFYKNGRGSFRVCNVEFNYGHTTGIPGYRGKNNLIRTNGQAVKIHYVSYANENVIVKIELDN